MSIKELIYVTVGAILVLNLLVVLLGSGDDDSTSTANIMEASVVSADSSEPMSSSAKVIYLHHSTGGVIWDGGGGINKLTSIISSSALSMLTAPRLPEFAYIAVIGLISFLFFKEVLSASKFQGKALESSLNMGIVPLLISFIAIVAYKIAEIL